MSIYIYKYCKECETVTPIFYDFNNKEWCCFLCGHVIEIPEHELPKIGKIRNERSERVSHRDRNSDE